MQTLLAILFKTFKLIIATVALGAILSASEVNGQVRQDTVYGTGIFLTKNAENNQPASGVSLYLTPKTMAMITPDTTYEFLTDNAGGAPFELPVYIDSTTDISEFGESSSTVFPTVGSELNAFFSEQEQGNISLYDLSGKVVKQQSFDGDQTYMNLSGLSTGMYVYAITSGNDVLGTGKFVKQDVPANGPASRPAQSSFKETQLYEATYKVKWVKEGFITDSTEIVLEDGDNGPLFFYLQPEEGIPQHQDIAGIVQNGDNNYTLMSGVDVRLINETTGDTLFAVTGSNGSFVFEDLPLDNDYLFSAGNVSGMGSFKNVPYTTPEEITIESDTINDHFDVVLKYIPATTTAQHIKQQTHHGTRQIEILYHYESNVSGSDQIIYDNWFDNLEASENYIFTFVKSTEPLNNTGITISTGTYNTQSYAEDITTPLGHTLYPILYANTTLNTADEKAFRHEIKRGVGFSEVGWYSVMRADAPAHTQEDKDIAQFMRSYWNSMYQDEKTWIDLNYLSDGFQTNQTSSSSDNNTSFSYDYIPSDKK